MLGFHSRHACLVLICSWIVFRTRHRCRGGISSGDKKLCFIHYRHWHLDGQPAECFFFIFPFQHWRPLHFRLCFGAARHLSSHRRMRYLFVCLHERKHWGERPIIGHSLPHIPKVLLCFTQIWGQPTTVCFFRCEQRAQNKTKEKVQNKSKMERS